MAVFHADSGRLSLNICRVSHFCGNTEDDGTARMKLELKLWAGVVVGTEQIPLGRLSPVSTRRTAEPFG